jgi:hypothetical protein
VLKQSNEPCPNPSTANYFSMLPRIITRIRRASKGTAGRYGRACQMEIDPLALCLYLLGYRGILFGRVNVEASELNRSGLG